MPLHVQNRIEVQMHPWMLVETTRVTEFEYYFACTRKGVHLYSVMSPGKMTFAVLELWCIVVNIKYTSATTTSHVVITCGPYKVATKYVINFNTQQSLLPRTLTLKLILTLTLTQKNNRRSEEHTSELQSR